MEITAKIKDDNLSELLSGGLVYKGEERAIAAILLSDGYVTLQGTNMGDVCTITPQGKAFIAQGGYTAIKQKKEQRLREAEAAKEKEQQTRLQEIEIQRIVSLELMKKDHEFQLKQNKANRRNNLLAAFISAIISFVVTLLMQSL